MSKIYGIGDEEELAEDLQKELPNRIIEELEKIKEEINDMKDGLQYDTSDYLYGRLQAFNIVEAILEDRIAEIKEER